MSKLTVAMIVKNEEQFIKGVIENVQPVADDMVITDTGSTDRTVEIIKKFNLRLYCYPWDGNEAAARNFTISKCKTDWILFLDADEFIDKKDYNKIQKFISSQNKYLACRIRLRHYISPKINLKKIYEQGGKGLYILYSSIRIFRNKKNIFYSRPIYASVDESLKNRQDKIYHSNIVFHHLDILRNKKKKRQKEKWYYKTVVSNYRKFPAHPEVNYARAHYYMLRGNFAKAAAYYKKTLRLKPDDVKTKLALGLNYVLKGEEEKGIALIKKGQGNSNSYAWEREVYINTAYAIIAHRMRDDNLTKLTRDI